MFEQLPTPTLLVDLDRLKHNIQEMQSAADARKVEVRPHIKTHKSIEVAKLQLQAGAAGLVCAKLSEAEVMLPAMQSTLPGRPLSIFIAHSLVDPNCAPRLRALSEHIDELVVACTSELHAIALEAVLAKADLRLPVMLAIDTGLGREGVRKMESAIQAAAKIATSPHMSLHGLYTHEGHLYSTTVEDSDAAVREVHRRLCEIRDAIVSQVGIEHLRLWPGSTVSARRMIELPGVDAVRPGSYVYGDVSHTTTTRVMETNQVALTVLSTVIDRPESDLALIDAGTKVFSGDRTAQGLYGREWSGRDLNVVKCSEEHGHVQGSDVEELQIGKRLRLVPAHTCPAVNLADCITLISHDQVIGEWKVDARGCVI
jgi:D-serine deaminase-like pyridoxal phosphate-dependent protein